MKKINFNNRYGLTAAVADGTKTMTRRIINLTDADKEYLDTAFDWDLRESVIIDRYAKYKVGEVVAVAQPYKEIAEGRTWINGKHRGISVKHAMTLPGWNNKMFVLADLMPKQILFTGIKVERLQDISDDDCLKEGINEDLKGVQYSFDSKIGYCGQFHFATARHAFASLIDKVSGKGTWKRNPFVFAYTYELVK